MPMRVVENNGLTSKNDGDETDARCFLFSYDVLGTCMNLKNLEEKAAENVLIITRTT
jgi:hypothetical protein